MKINSVPQSTNFNGFAAGKIIKKSMAKFADSGFMNKRNMSNVSTPAKYAAGLAILSVCAKDALGCYYYVTQSLNNKKIPKEKRGFVAALDLSNGAFNITTQLLLSKLLLTEKVLDSTYKALYSAEKKVKKANKAICRYFGKKELIEQTSKELKKGVEVATKDLHAMGRIGFGTVISLVVTSVIAKRIIVPLFATPVAGIIEKKYMSGDTDKKTETPIQKDFAEKYKNPFQRLKELQGTKSPKK